MKTSQRFHFIDNLRSIALLLGIIFHAALAYGPHFQNIWIAADTTATHPFFDYLSLWLHLFRMPLFFFIAGFCSLLLIEKYGSKGFITHRLKRVLLPFLVFFPLAGAAYFHALTWGASIVQSVPPILTLFAQMEPVLSTMHLWFLWYLIQFCTVLWLLQKSNTLLKLLLNNIVHPVSLCLVIPLIIFVSLIDQPVPFPAPDKLTPTFRAYGFYGTLYLLGAGVYHRKDKIVKITCFLKMVTVIAIMSLVTYFMIIPEAPTLTMIKQAAASGQFSPSGSWHVLQSAIQTIAIISWTALVLMLGQRYLNQQSVQSRFISDASYWVYLVHVPVLIYIQMPLINLECSAILKFIISVAVTFTLSLLSYYLLVRSTWLGVFLNGKKQNARTKAIK